MPNNTRSRSEQLNTLAAEIAARENINPARPPTDSRPYINEIVERGKCHTETARRVWARFMRRARHPLNAWGGLRKGAGRKKPLDKGTD